MKDCDSYCIGGSSCDGCPHQDEDDIVETSAKPDVTFALDFLGKSIYVGDEVIVVFGKHLRTSVIESFGYQIGLSTKTKLPRTFVKVKGLVREIESDDIIKV